MFQGKVDTPTRFAQGADSLCPGTWAKFYNKHLSWKIKFLFDIICLICLPREVSEMGLRFFENVLMSYNYVIAIHDRLALFKKSFLDNKIKYV